MAHGIIILSIYVQFRRECFFRRRLPVTAEGGYVLFLRSTADL